METMPEKQKGVALSKSRKHTVAVFTVLYLNTPPQCEHSSSHGNLAESVETKETTETLEVLDLQCLRENISNIILRRDIGDSEVLGVDEFTKEMVFDVNVLDTCMEKGIFGEIDGRVVIAENGSRSRHGNVDSS